MRVRYTFVVYGNSFAELEAAARADAEKMFGYAPTAEGFVQFDVSDFASSVADSAVLYRADVTVEIGFS